MKIQTTNGILLFMNDKSDRKLKALIADDSASIRVLLSHTLTKMGYEVVECTNGTEVWK